MDSIFLPECEMPFSIDQSIVLCNSPYVRCSNYPVELYEHSTISDEKKGRFSDAKQELLKKHIGTFRDVQPGSRVACPLFWPPKESMVWCYTGWWFGTSILFSHILGIIIPIDFHIFQRGGPTTNQYKFVSKLDEPSNL